MVAVRGASLSRIGGNVWTSATSRAARSLPHAGVVRQHGYMLNHSSDEWGENANISSDTTAWVSSQKRCPWARKSPEKLLLAKNCRYESLRRSNATSRSALLPSTQVSMTLFASVAALSTKKIASVSSLVDGGVNYPFNLRDGSCFGDCLVQLRLNVLRLHDCRYYQCRYYGRRHVLHVFPCVLVIDGTVDNHPCYTAGTPENDF